MIQLEEAAPLVAVGMFLLILLVQKLERDPFLRELFGQVRRHRARAVPESSPPGEEEPFQIVVAEDARVPGKEC